MKIRIMGTKHECEVMQDFFRKKLQNCKGYSVSRLYANRGSTDIYRLYIEFNISSNTVDFERLKGGNQ